jgi:hypothetical protein
MLVVMIGELRDLALEVSDGVERATTDGLIPDKREPVLDLIEPGAVRGA